MSSAYLSALAAKSHAAGFETAPIFCPRCYDLGRSPFSVGVVERHCPSCMVSCRANGACPNNAEHGTTPSLRCLASGSEGSCNCAVATHLEQPIRLTTAVRGRCSTCCQEEDVQRETPMSGIGFHWPIHFVDDPTRGRSTRADVHNMLMKAKEESERTYCRSCLMFVLSMKKIVCRTCAKERSMTLGTATAGFFCEDCQSETCVDYTVDPETHTVALRCIMDSRHLSFTPSLTCTRCGTCSARDERALVVLHNVEGRLCPSGNSNSCRGTRVYRYGCSMNHSFCSGCISRVIADSAIAPDGQQVRLVCIACNNNKEIATSLADRMLVPGEDKHSSASKDIRELWNRLHMELLLNIGARCTCAAGRSQQPTNDALEPPARPIITCMHCGESYCAVCTKKGGCSHSASDYNLSDVLKPVMQQWQIVRVAHVIAIVRTFIIVERFLKTLNAFQRSELLRSPYCPALSVLDRTVRLSVTDCSKSVFNFGRGWSALSDEENGSKVKKILDLLNVPSNDIRVS
jgi:hypothetical protein